MENHSLSVLNKLAKVGKALSQLVRGCCILGLVACTIGFLGLCFGALGLRFSGTTLSSLLASSQITVGGIWSAILSGIILCSGHLYLSAQAAAYFSLLLTDGTPFTIFAADKLKRLGILKILIPLLCQIFASIAQGGLLEPGQTPVLAVDCGGSLVTGLFLILGSLLCRCGAELLGPQHLRVVSSQKEEAMQ